MAERPNPLLEDLDCVLADTWHLWESLRDGRVFMTGGTGFFGCWMLETLLHANRELGLGATAVVLSRDPDRFAQKVPHLANDPAVSLVQGDVCSFAFPQGPFTHVLHMATETNTALSNPKPSTYFDVSVDGTRRVLDFARQAGAGQLLYTSSGAVYGPQPHSCERLSEDETIAPAPEHLDMAYGQGKRAGEFLCCAAHAETGIEAKIARCFAFVGPYLPLESGFAIGNFIDDALSGRAIAVLGDGRPVRSYLYAADLATWVWTILFRGDSARPYNVGSDSGICIADLAEMVTRVINSDLSVSIAKSPDLGQAPSRYVPDTSRASGELGLRARVALETAIERTAAWHRILQPARMGMLR